MDRGVLVGRGAEFGHTRGGGKGFVVDGGLEGRGTDFREDELSVCCAWRSKGGSGTLS